MKPSAPEFSALMTILPARSGPVISTRRFCEVGRRRAPRSSRRRACRRSRAGSRACRRRRARPGAPCAGRAARGGAHRSSRCSAATKASACGVRISSARSCAAPWTSTPSVVVVLMALPLRRSTRPAARGVVDRQRAAQRRGVRGDLQRAAGVGGGDRLGAGGEQVLGLAARRARSRPRAAAGCRCRPSRSRSPGRRARAARARGCCAAARAAAARTPCAWARWQASW